MADDTPVTHQFAAGDPVWWQDPDAAPGEWGFEPTAALVTEVHVPGSARQVHYGPWEGRPKPGKVDIEFKHGGGGVLNVDMSTLRRRDPGGKESDRTS